MKMIKTNEPIGFDFQKAKCNHLPYYPPSPTHSLSEGILHRVRYYFEKVKGSPGGTLATVCKNKVLQIKLKQIKLLFSVMIRQPFISEKP